MKLFNLIRSIIISPGEFFYKSYLKRNIYKYFASNIARFTESRDKKIWLSNLSSMNYPSIGPTIGYLVLPPFVLAPNFSKKVVNVCNRIINEDRKHSSGSKDFLRQILTDKDILDNPVLLKYALSDDLLSIVSKYLGCAPVLTQVKLLKSVETNNHLQSSQLFHCDHDDVRQVKIFLNIRDVTLKNGPLSVVSADISEEYRNRHGYVWGGAGGHLKPEDTEDLERNMDELIGPEGQVALVDTTNCFHFGSTVKSGERYIYYLQFTTMSNFLINPFFSLLPKKYLYKVFPYLKVAKKAKIIDNLYALGLR